MTSAAIAFLVGLTILLAALFLVVLMWWREATQLSQLTISTTRAEAAEKLRGAIGDGAVGLEHALTSKRAVDDALASAIATVCQAPLGAPLVQGLAIDALLVLGALAPFLAALLGAAERIAALPGVIGSDAPYVAAVGAIPAAFSGVPQGAKLSALLVVIAGIVAVCRYALLRPEAREARALHALVHATAGSAPDTKVPQSSKVLALTAPSRGMAPAVLASVAFALLSAAAVGTLVVTAPLRAANTVPLTYQDWSDLFVESAEVTPPAVAAGRALEKGPSLIIGRDQVQLSASPMIELERGALPADWTARALVSREIAADARPLVLAAPTASLSTMMAIMAYLGEHHGLKRYQLVVRRNPPVVRSPAKRVQAAIPAEIGDAGAENIYLDVDPTTVKLNGEPLDLSRGEGLRKLRGTLGPRAVRVGVRVHGELTYGRLIEVLALADGLCDGGVDCGLPGRGISVVLGSAPAGPPSPSPSP